MSKSPLSSTHQQAIINNVSSFKEENEKEEQIEQKLLLRWKQIQLQVASDVKVHPDTPSQRRFRILSTESVEEKEEDLYGGVDVSFPEDNDDDDSVAAYIVMNNRGRVVYQDFLFFRLTVPYVSSFLAFREIDPLETLVRKQLQEAPSLTPRIILVDGNGRLHARRAGIACFLGVRTGIPTIGVGKTLYCEGGLQTRLVQQGIENSLKDLDNDNDNNNDNISPTIAKEETVIIDQKYIDARHKDGGDDDGDGDGDESLMSNEEKEELIVKLADMCCGMGVKLMGDDGDVLACALFGHGGKASGSKRHGPKRGTKKPIFISIGHDVSLEKAVMLCAKLSFARIPEPVRQADLWGRSLLRDKKKVRNKPT